MDQIIYIYARQAEFIKKDIALLSKNFRVISPKHSWSKKAVVPFLFILQLAFLLRHLPSSRAVFVMFGGYWSFLPALTGRYFKKPVFIILGGTDCVSFPSLHYGSLRKPLLRMFIRWSYNLCTELIPVDGSLVESESTYYEGRDFDRQGFLVFFPFIKTPYRIIHNGFDVDFYSPLEGFKRHNTFITIAAVDNMQRYYLKGIDKVFQVASLFPQCSFRIIGISFKVIEKIGRCPENVVCHEWMSSEEIKKFLNESEFYLQLSISEGFPNALCEAMLMGCIPIGSRTGGIPGIIGDTGFIAGSSDINLIRQVIEEALKTDEDQRKDLASRARSRVCDNFTLHKREEQIMELFNRHVCDHEQQQ